MGKRNNNKKRKKQADGGDAVSLAYKDFMIHPHECVSQPVATTTTTSSTTTTTRKIIIENQSKVGTPHSLFNSSFAVIDNHNATTTTTTRLPTIVHCHVNGLCIITMGGEDNDWQVESFQWLFSTQYEEKETDNNDDKEKEETSSMSQGERRKLISRLLSKGCPSPPPSESDKDNKLSLATSENKDVKQKGKSSRIVCPWTPLLQVTWKKAQIMENPSNNDTTDNVATTKSMIVKAGVWGIVLETNRILTKELLTTDPLLDGYIAIVQPVGSFPPKTMTQKQEQTMTGSTTAEDTDNVMGKKARLNE